MVDFRELIAPDGAVDHPYYSYVPVEWAKQWPAEEIWRARKRGGRRRRSGARATA